VARVRNLTQSIMDGSDMTLLIIGLILFFAIHFVPAMPGLKASLVGRMGENGYKGLFSLVSLAGLVLMIWGYVSAPFETVYTPPDGGRMVASVLVLLGLIALAAFHLQSYTRKFLKHPMLVGIALWSLGHLFANGDLASVLLFGSFFAYSIIDMTVATAQGRVKQVTPKAAHDVIGLVAGIAIYAILLYLHPIVIGVPVM